MNEPTKHPPSAEDAEADVLPTEHTSDGADTASLIEEIKETADKLHRDHATRGDLKILSRALRELRYAFKVFTPYRKHRKVTVFGSARTPSSHPAYQAAVEFGRKIAEHGWMVLTGAGSGIMEAANVGAGREMSMGVNIMLPFEQSANHIVRDDEKLIYLKYFFTRKLLFVKEVHAVVLFPGGFGTLDEAFEVLTLVQTGKRDLMPLVFVDQPGGTYWSAWEDFIREQLFKAELVSPEDLSLFKITTDLDEAVEEILGFYTVYNSMRYVRGRLVLRLHAEPDDALMERLNDEFGDICERGGITKVPTHPFEADDAHLADLPRIAFRFDRRQVGRLRQMVDLLNLELRGQVDRKM
ncbi:MAG: TIGR00730 family Rossman fold protein [Planctomycetaceae bacterium]